MPKKKGYVIVVQMRADYRPIFKGDRWDRHKQGERYWPNHRRFCAWPKIFTTSTEAHDFMKQNFTFKNMHGRKMSVSVMRTGFYSRLGEFA